MTLIHVHDLPWCWWAGMVVSAIVLVLVLALVWWMDRNR